MASVACGDPRLGGVEMGFRVSGAALDFGRAVVGSEVIRTVTLEATGKGGAQVDVSATPPFFSTGPAEVPGAGVVALDVVFRVTEGPAAGVLTLRSNDRTVEI